MIGPNLFEFVAKTGMAAQFRSIKAELLPKE